jgi:hypothetical protein
MPVMDSGKSDAEYDDDMNVKMEDDDDDDDDDGMDDQYSIGYYPHATSLLVSKRRAARLRYPTFTIFIQSFTYSIQSLSSFFIQY